MRIGVPAKRVGVAAVAIVAIAVIGLAIVHARFVPTRALAMVRARIADTGYLVNAETLDYNLLTLTVRLTGISVATPTAAASPFFTAREIRAALPWAILSGRLTIDRIEMVSPAVTLQRDALGHDNWS